MILDLVMVEAPGVEPPFLSVAAGFKGSLQLSCNFALDFLGLVAYNTQL